MGDVIVVKFCTIDKAHYEFWRTFETAVAGVSNPFAAPTTVRTNVKGGLGIWGGYGISLDTIYATK